MVKRIILAKPQQGWLGTARTDSLPGHQSFIIPSYENRFAKCPTAMQQSANKNDRIGPGRTGLERNLKLLGVVTPHDPSFVHPESWYKVGYAKRELTTVFSENFLHSSSSCWSDGQNAPPPKGKPLGTPDLRQFKLQVNQSRRQPSKRRGQPGQMGVAATSKGKEGAY